ncbi:MAG: succinate dehydrogenase cytochrome b subunit [Kiritimatiellae bacterium]|nr:succinate dehydrogenase cytochrome b subunit [Kiritimatiellia bacterium]MCO5061091.1 succinate dehydrogenase cytochrome b subunit [Kiritimatiellia bacterium]MCO6400100.1 succinate dehydrogenase cytochrome b subunit [Verrucomicrobiota bacterium]
MSKPQIWKSTVGKKVLASVSGLALVAFVIVHLIGNLTLFVGRDGKLFNSYAHHLESLGPLLYVAEVGLILIVVLHIATALGVRIGQRRARPQGYGVYGSKHGPSKQTLASRSMAITGVIILLFIPLHVWMFKFNAGRGFTDVDFDGHSVKDLYLVVLTAFKDPMKAWAYVGIMALLGLHLRHGFWSAFQSLGAFAPKRLPAFYAAGLICALLLAAGFIALPLYLLYCGPDPATLRGGVGG